MTVAEGQDEQDCRYRCTDCGHDFNEDEVVPNYECNSCGTEFSRDDSADGDSHRCPQCGKFSSRVDADEPHCPNCGSSNINDSENPEK